MTKVDQQTPEVAAMLAAAQPVVDLALGGANMRARGETYLPRFPMETVADYNARVASSWLFDGVGKAIEDYTGRLFDKPMTPEDDGELAEWCSNIDNEGRDLSNFAQDVFLEAVKTGIAFLMVDAPPRPAGVTKGQAKALNLRPYCSLIPMASVLGWKVATINSRPTLTQWRIMERVDADDADEFTDAKVDQIRVLDLIEGRVQGRLFRKNAKAGSWYEHDAFLTDFTEIMVAPVYTGRTGFFRAKPPLARLAEINMAHWRSQSDQANIMHHARAPLKYFHGYQPDDLRAFAENPGYVVVNADPNAKVGTLEHSGAAIAAGREELRDLEQQMQWVGLQLVLSKHGQSTATGDMIDEKKNTSALSMWADNLKDALERALIWLADVGGLAGAKTGVVMSTDLLALSLRAADMDVLIKIGLTPRALLSEAKRRGLVADDMDIDAEAEAIAAGLMDTPDGAF